MYSVHCTLYQVDIVHVVYTIYMYTNNTAAVTLIRVQCTSLSCININSNKADIENNELSINR